jgi:hypothetical protein
MRVPILYMGNPEEKLWLTDDRSVSPTRQPILIDSTDHVYQPTDVRGPVLVKMRTCTLAFYDAAYKAGYQVVWID